MGRFSRAVVAIGVSAALLVACSSSGKSHVDVNKVLTKAEYIKESDRICADYKGRIDAVVGNAGNGLSVEQYKKIFNDTLIPLFQAEHRELVGLKPPKADAKTLADALLAMNSGINTIIGRVGGAVTIEDLRSINPKGIARWKFKVGKYGMHVCGSIPAK